MDQGLAAVLGALVGAVATGGGTYVTARSSERLHKRQARRQVYAAWLQDVASTKFRLDELRPMFNDLPRRRRSAEIDDLLDEIRILIKSMERHLAALSLEGPSELNYLATLVTGGARLLHARLERWREEYSDVTIPSTGEQEYEELKKGFEDKIERAGYLASVHV